MWRSITSPPGWAPSVLSSVLGLHELVYAAMTAGRSTREFFPFLFAALAIFLLLTAVLNVGLHWLDRKYSVGLRRT